MEFKITSTDAVSYFLTIGPDHLATPHTAHGGLIAALIDGSLGVAALSVVCENNKVVSTIEYKVNFLAPALLNDRLVAKGMVEQKGSRILVTSCTVIVRTAKIR